MTTVSRGAFLEGFEFKSTHGHLGSCPGPQPLLSHLIFPLNSLLKYQGGLFRAHAVLVELEEKRNSFKAKWGLLDRRTTWKWSPQPAAQGQSRLWGPGPTRAPGVSPWPLGWEGRFESVKHPPGDQATGDQATAWCC